MPHCMTHPEHTRGTYIYLDHVQQNSSSSHTYMSPLHSVSVLNNY